ncbi:hypothetical protein TcWFU_008010 [Taenia crassiceps]|uniref:Uncharacterized protein n=1 Tax=Taenia crassiceps TaxID=6207 RepID=A0ABR4QC25_9CEST
MNRHRPAHLNKAFVGGAGRHKLLRGGMKASVITGSVVVVVVVEEESSDSPKLDERSDHACARLALTPSLRSQISAILSNGPAHAKGLTVEVAKPLGTPASTFLGQC